MQPMLGKFLCFNSLTLEFMLNEDYWLQFMLLVVSVRLLVGFRNQSVVVKFALELRQQANECSYYTGCTKTIL
jgi:hypothetical protein